MICKSLCVLVVVADVFLLKIFEDSTGSITNESGKMCNAKKKLSKNNH